MNEKIAAVIVPGQSRIEEIGSGFRTANTIDWLQVAFVILLPIVFCLLGAFVFWVIKTIGFESGHPRDLFDGLCHLHRLTSSQRKFLQTVARKASIVNPALFFADPSRLEIAYDKIQHTLPLSMRNRNAMLELKLHLLVE